jgi:hypothetical protein
VREAIFLKETRMTMAYTFETEMLPLSDTAELEEGQREGVYFTVASDMLEEVLDTLDRWFEGFDVIVLLAQGTTAKGLGFVLLEWDGCKIDPEFLEVLDHDESVQDYTLYLRDKEL